MQIKLFLPVLLLIPAGCSVGDEALYPSLKPRPIESAGRVTAAPTGQPVAEAPAFHAVPDSDSRRLKALAGELQAAERGFNAALAEAGRLGHAKATPGSEEWAVRAQALGRLVAAQASAASIAEEARDVEDRLSGAALESGMRLPSDNPAALLRQEATALAQRQQQDVDRFAAVLNP